MPRRLLAALLLTLLCKQTFAAFVTGNDLNTWADSYVRTMESSASTQDDGLKGYQYISYVRGVLDAYEIALCVPMQTTAGQAAAITRRYVKDHPERWQEPGAMLVLSAMQTAFPCKPQAKSKPQS